MTCKRKTKQLRWLVTRLMLVMTMVMPASTWARDMYTVYDNGTLTFMYGDKSGSGNVYDVPSKSTPGWLANKESITTVIFDASFESAQPTSCSYWFDSCSNLTSIQNIEYLNTDNVTDMMFMFRGCSGLTSLDLSSFNTAKVTDMSYMFYKCSGLTSLDLSSFNTANVTDMSQMFRDCNKLTTLDLSNFDTSNVKNMGDMFDGCSSLESLILSNFNTANVTNMNNMFYGCKKLIDLDLSKFNTANVTDMGNMFYGCSGLTSLDLSKFNTDKVTGMSEMFYGCSSLTSLDLSNFNTAEVTTMNKMFDGCKKLTSLDLSSFNTAKVTDMSYMFYKCSGLTSLDLSSFNTANVTNMSYMFYGCSGLTTIYVSDNYETGKATTNSYMFHGCSNLVGAKGYDPGKTDIDMANYTTGYFSYGIKTVADWNNFADNVNKGNTKMRAGLLKDITNVLTTIGSNDFTGTFDGCGHTISGLNFNSTFSALFAQNSGTIKNLGILNATIAEGASGNICQTNSGTIESCYFMGTKGSQSAGGICPTNNGTMTKCYYLADVDNGNGGKTEEQFKSGEVCYLLNNGTTNGTQIWYQNLSAEGDTWPVCNNTGNNTVYYAILFCGGTSNAGNTYANTTKVKIDHDMPEGVSPNTTKHIYQKECQREGCRKTLYYADAAGTIEATPNAEETAFAVASYTLADATEYNSEAEFTVTSLAYERTFYDDKWMAVYVPFAIDCSQLENDYEMATINNFHEYEQENGTYKVVLEVKRVTKGGTIPALTPCLIRMKTVPAKEVEKTLNFDNAEFSAAADKSIDCSSVTRYYQFFGTLNRKTGLIAGTDFVLDAGKLKNTSVNTVLPAQRWYLSATDRNSTSVEPATMLRSISIKVIGDGEATGIEDIHVNTESGADASGVTGIYDLQGRKINSEPTKGMYIKNGKKYIK